MDSRGVLVQRRNVIQKERLSICHCLVLTCLIVRISTLEHCPLVLVYFLHQLQNVTVLWDQELTLILVLLLFSELLFEFSTCPPTDKVDCNANHPLGNILCRSSGGQWPVLSTKGLFNRWDSSLWCCQAPGESFGYNLLLYHAASTAMQRRLARGASLIIN